MGFDENCVWVKKNLDALEKIALKFWKQKLYMSYQSTWSLNGHPNIIPTSIPPTTIKK